MPSRHDGPFPCFWRELPATARCGALLAGLTFLPAACGGDEIVARDVVEPPADAGVTPLPDGPPDVPGDAGGASPPPEPPPPGIAQLPDVASGGSAGSDVLALGALEWLQSSCGECHANGDNGARFAGGLDLARLIESGLIVAGSSASSPLLLRVRDGSMPPADSSSRAPTVGDIALLADFIDQLSTEPPPRCDPLPLLELDAVYAALLADVQAQPADERRYLRYVSLTEASNARLCGPALEQRRQALLELVNSLSMESLIKGPSPVDAAALLYRVDLRDYGWDRAIDRDADGNVDFADGWEAALAAMPTGVAFEGLEASALATETGSRVPVSGLSAFVRAATEGSVYRELLGVPANLYDMQLSFGLDVVLELYDGNVQRAGFVRASPRAEVIASRYSLGETGARAWWTIDVDTNDFDSGSMYEDPLNLSSGPWTQTIWELPNGLHGYLVSDSNGEALSETPGDCVGACVRPGQRHAMACLGCHADGLLPLQDIIRAFVEDNLRSFDSETYEDVLATYPPAAELAEIIARDNARHRAALEQLGIQPGAPDPISRVYLDYDRPLDLERAAAELGVPVEVLAEHLGALPALAPLGVPSGTVERSVFDAAQLDALCRVHATSRNRPAACP